MIIFCIRQFMGWRVSAKEELLGLDHAEHGDMAYDYGKKTVIKTASNPIVKNLL